MRKDKEKTKEYAKRYSFEHKKEISIKHKKIGLWHDLEKGINMVKMNAWAMAWYEGLVP